MGKRAKKRKAEILVEYLEPLSDISAIDIAVKKSDNHNFTSGRLVSSSTKKLIVRPYLSDGVYNEHGIYIEPLKDGIELLEVRIVNEYTRAGFKGFLEERYKRSICFRGEALKIVGRFLNVLLCSLEARHLRISTTPKRCKPISTVISVISAEALIGREERNKTFVASKTKRRVVKKEKEFFFKEQLEEVKDDNDNSKP